MEFFSVHWHCAPDPGPTSLYAPNGHIVFNHVFSSTIMYFHHHVNEIPNVHATIAIIYPTAITFLNKNNIKLQKR